MKRVKRGPLGQQKEIEGEWLGARYRDPSNRLSGHVLCNEHFATSKTGNADQRGESRGQAIGRIPNTKEGCPDTSCFEVVNNAMHTGGR